MNMCHGDVFCEYDGEMICINDHLVASGLARRPSDGGQTGEGNRNRKGGMTLCSLPWI